MAVCIIYSFTESAGFSVAALKLRAVTVNIVIIITINKAAANTHQYNLVLYAKVAVHLLIIYQPSGVATIKHPSTIFTYFVLNNSRMLPTVAPCTFLIAISLFLN